ncbi:BQ5605_C006g04346 [Microbotryum silenes-dioicae]|uniref:BQ5605_C006g04346 protein n=1 Tax=Microbotryum silenes-dioicae TaxID=796604 RepID=A0A2X0M6P6_9BASI|nr:BQ5605_C006g04346 [Microbotryum silenes-dioicae]
MPSRHPQRRGSVECEVPVVLAGDPKQCLPVIPSHRQHKSSTLASWNSDFWGEVEVVLDFMRLRIGARLSSVEPATTTARARAFRSGPTQFFAEPCLYRIKIDVCEVARSARRRT